MGHIHLAGEPSVAPKPGGAENHDDRQQWPRGETKAPGRHQGQPPALRAGAAGGPPGRRRLAPPFAPRLAGASPGFTRSQPPHVAFSTIQAQSWGKEIPTCAACSGTRLSAVIPGWVLVSR